MFWQQHYARFFFVCFFFQLCTNLMHCILKYILLLHFFFIYNTQNLYSSPWCSSLQSVLSVSHGLPQSA